MVGTSNSLDYDKPVHWQTVFDRRCIFYGRGLHDACDRRDLFSLIVIKCYKPCHKLKRATNLAYRQQIACN